MIIRNFQGANGDSYELRSAGASLRLYRNRVFHTQVNAARLANGGVWDLLWLPALLQRPEYCKNILVLGVGLGAAIIKLRQFFPAAKIIAVDIDPVHLRLAKHLHTASSVEELSSKRFWQSLDLDLPVRREAKGKAQGEKTSRRNWRSNRIEWVQADALAWLSRQKNAAFDVIIDDLFIDSFDGQQGDPGRVIGLDQRLRGSGMRRLRQAPPWIKVLSERLSAQGLLVANCASTRDARAGIKCWQALSKGRSKAAAMRAPSQAWVLRTRGYENRVLVASCANHGKQGFRRLLAQSLQERRRELIELGYSGSTTAALGPLGASSIAV